MSDVDEQPDKPHIAGIPAPLLIALYFLSIVVLMVGLILFMAESTVAPRVTWSLSSPSAIVLLSGIGMLLAISGITTVGWFQMSRFSLSEFLLFTFAAGAALGLTVPHSPFHQFSGLICALGAFAAGILTSGILSLWNYSKRLRRGVLVASAIFGTGFGQPWVAIVVLLGFLFSMPLLGVVRHPARVGKPLFPRPGTDQPVVPSVRARTEELNRVNLN